MKLPEEYKEIKVTLLKGVVGDQATQWWTREDWDEHYAYVKHLKEIDEYLKPYEITVRMPKDDLFFESKPVNFSKSVMLIPKGYGKNLKIPKFSHKATS